MQATGEKERAALYGSKGAPSRGSRKTRARKQRPSVQGGNGTRWRGIEDVHVVPCHAGTPEATRTRNQHRPSGQHKCPPTTRPTRVRARQGGPTQATSCRRRAAAITADISSRRQNVSTPGLGSLCPSQYPLWHPACWTPWKGVAGTAASGEAGPHHLQARGVGIDRLRLIKLHEPKARRMTPCRTSSHDTTTQGRTAARGSSPPQGATLGVHQALICLVKFDGSQVNLLCKV